MRIQKTALNVLIVSSLIILAALALALFGQGMKFAFGAQVATNFEPLFVALLAGVALSFLFGWLRYELAGGLALAIALLHDQLLTLAICAFYSLAFGLSAYTPALVFASAAFTCVFSIPLLRAARGHLRAVTGLSREQAASQAVQTARPVKTLVVALSVLVLAAFLLSGNIYMAGSLLPLIAGLIAAVLSSSLITPYVWAAFVFKARRR